MQVDRETALVLLALELESPQIGAVNRRIVALGGQPLPPREPWLTEAREMVANPRKEDE
jgi:hypothetical protein